MKETKIKYIRSDEAIKKGLFHFIKNRDPKHMSAKTRKEIKKSLKEDGWQDAQPMCTTCQGGIVDGQGRYLLVIELLEEGIVILIAYIEENYTDKYAEENIVIKFNSLHDNWTHMDYIKWFANVKNSQIHKDILELSETMKFDVPVVARAFKYIPTDYNLEIGVVSKMDAEGNPMFIADYTYDEAKETLESLDIIRNKLEGSISRFSNKLANAFIVCLQIDEVDNQELIKKCRRILKKKYYGKPKNDKYVLGNYEIATHFDAIKEALGGKESTSIDANGFFKKESATDETN